MTDFPTQDFGIKIALPTKAATSKKRTDLGFDSAVDTYMLVKKITAVVTTNPYVIVHNLGYIPKVFIFEILSDHNRKLPYDDGSNKRDFSVSTNTITIRGVTSGTFRILVFGQNIL